MTDYTKDNLRFSFDVPFTEAIAAAKARYVVLPEKYYGQLQAIVRSRAFTVSGMASLEQIQLILNSLEKATKQGIPLNQWQKEVDIKQFQLPKGRAELIYRNAIQSHYNAGREEQFKVTEDLLPYLMFSAINDSRTSKICRALNGIIRPKNDPFWKTHSPQCHHGCRSLKVELTEAQAVARSVNGLGLNKAVTEEMTAQEGFGYPPSMQQDDRLNALAMQKLATMPPVIANKFNTLMTTKPAELVPASLDYTQALAVVEQKLHSTDFANFYNNVDSNQAVFPVGVLSPSDQQLLSASSRLVLLSRESLAEHKIKHADIGLADYQQLATIIAGGEIFETRKKRYVLLHSGDFTYRAALKVTQDESEVYLLSLIKQKDEKADKEIRSRFNRIK